MQAVSGRVKRLAVSMPPRHGKSVFLSHYLPAWLLGHRPEWNVICCSYAAELAAHWSRKVRDTVNEAAELGVFSSRVRRDSSAADRWQIDGHEGGMFAAGRGGAITGRGANVLLPDDLLKNAEEANSPRILEAAWEWWTSTALTRLEPGGIVLMIGTRWAPNDVIGRAIAQQENDDAEPWTVVNLPAFAGEDDPLGRQPGEALWPERFDERALSAIRAEIGSYWFETEYQGNPKPREGGLFRRDWFLGQIVERDAVPQTVVFRARFWDLAAGGGDNAVGGLVSVSQQPYGFWFEDVVKTGTSPAAVETLFAETLKRDGPQVPVYIEQEPGSQSKLWFRDLLRRWPQHSIFHIPVKGSKESRANVLAARAEARYVFLVRGAWNEDFVGELCSFNPSLDGKNHDDQLDMATLAYSRLSREAVMPLTPEREAA